MRPCPLKTCSGQMEPWGSGVDGDGRQVEWWVCQKCWRPVAAEPDLSDHPQLFGGDG